MLQCLYGCAYCRMTEGEVSDVQTDPTDEYWSINIKKGLLSLLQVKINGRSTIVPVVPESYLSDSQLSQRNRFYDMISPVPGRSRLGVSRAADNIFKVIEVLKMTMHYFMFCLAMWRVAGERQSLASLNLYKGIIFIHCLSCAKKGDSFKHCLLSCFTVLGLYSDWFDHMRTELNWWLVLVGRERRVWDQVRDRLWTVRWFVVRQQDDRHQGQELRQVPHSQLVRTGSLRRSAARQVWKGTCTSEVFFGNFQ